MRGQGDWEIGRKMRIEKLRRGINLGMTVGEGMCMEGS